MFSKRPIVSVTYGYAWEKLRTAIEVLTGQYAHIMCIDFNTCRGKIKIGSQIFSLRFLPESEEFRALRFEFGQGWAIAMFPGEGGYHYFVKVLYEPERKNAKEFSDHMKIWSTQEQWVGRSAIERKRESASRNAIDWFKASGGKLPD